MREYGFSLTRILPYSRIFYAVNDENINLRFRKWHLFFKGEGVYAHQTHLHSYAIGYVTLKVFHESVSIQIISWIYIV